MEQLNKKLINQMSRYLKTGKVLVKINAIISFKAIKTVHNNNDSPIRIVTLFVIRII